MASGHLALSVRYTVASRPDGRLEAGRGARSGPERPRSGVLGPDLALEGQIWGSQGLPGPGLDGGGLAQEGLGQVLGPRGPTPYVFGAPGGSKTVLDLLGPERPSASLCGGPRPAKRSLPSGRSEALA